MRWQRVRIHYLNTFLLFSLTAGHDKTIKLWDLRRFGDQSSPIGVLEGHVPLHETRCKKIHRPVFYHPISSSSSSSTSKWRDSTFVLTGGQQSYSLSLFHADGFDSMSTTLTDQPATRSAVDVSLCSRGKLPETCGDAVCIAVDGSRVAVSTEQAEVLLLEPSSTCTSDSSKDGDGEAQ